MHEMRDETRDRPPHREFHPLLFPTSVTLKMQETGPTVYSPYPRRLQCLTIWSKPRSLTTPQNHVV